MLVTLDLSYTNSWPDTKDGSFWSRFDLSQWLRNGKHHILFQKVVWATNILLYFCQREKAQELTKEYWWCGLKRAQFMSWPITSSLLWQCFNSAVRSRALPSQLYSCLQELLLPKFNQWCLTGSSTSHSCSGLTSVGAAASHGRLQQDPSHSLCFGLQSPSAQRDVQAGQTMCLLQL